MLIGCSSPAIVTPDEESGFTLSGLFNLGYCNKFNTIWVTVD